MSITIERPGRISRLVAAVAASALSVGGLSLAAAPAEAAQTGNATGGTATWGLSTYLNSANPGRPNPLASAYGAPSTFDATSRLSTLPDASAR